ncbi:MAG TPA: hypothetical protein PLF13_08615 [candidate division Zixibacteria bacterium]|nr:hypothetical protein [candidate division Zixibacteria bacterium]
MAKAPDNDAGQITFAGELLRKGTHIGALVIPAGYYFLGLSKGQMLAIMVPIALAMVLVDISRFKGWWLWTGFAYRFEGGMIRAHEKAGDFTGASYILTTVCICVIIFSKPVTIAALAFIIVGDTLAALIGRRYGRHKFWNKSLEGSTACLIGTIAVALVAPDLALSVGITGAVVAAVVEALPLGVDDNVSVPLLSGLVMTLLERVMSQI